MRRFSATFAVLLVAASATGCTGPRVSGPSIRSTGTDEASVMVAYVEALRSGDTDRAISMLYLPPRVEPNEDLLVRMNRISLDLRAGDHDFRVVDSRAHVRLALVLYGTGGAAGELTPVFLIRNPGKAWKLHHPSTAGSLQNALRDRHDFLEMRELANWAARRMAELSRPVHSATDSVL